MKHYSSIVLLGLLLLLQGCDFLVGSKEDETVDEVFEEGAIDPNLVPDVVGYVPVFPFFNGFSNPVDVYVGYDELLYVVDDNGVHVLDQTGRSFQTIPIPGATDVVQDRRLHTYIAGRARVNRSGTDYDLAAVYHLVNTGSANGYQIIDTLIHPDVDDSRRNSSFRGADDELVAFTGLATLHDNTLYVSRTGPRNDVTSFVRPDNTVLFFNADGGNIGYAAGLNPVTSSLRSSLGLTSIATFANPPQQAFGIPELRHFMITQGSSRPDVEFRALLILEIVEPDVGATYREAPGFLNFDTTKADRFLYESFRFKKPEDIYIGLDDNTYIYVVDSETDSLYQFTTEGWEGVNPPPNTGETKQVIASFGGLGSGPFQFNDPSGVCFFRGTVYVADKGNNRISRFRLSTDLE